jgi:MoxR-like ATPase
MTALQHFEARLQAAVGSALVGMQPAVRCLAAAVVARGHVLVEGVPGIGKTRLSRTLAAALGGRFKRIQGTADLMPSDIIGVHVYDAAQSKFTFRPGPLFADVLLFDEINRAGPKTQSALLEAMEERQVSVDDRRYPLPREFLVVATQNPRDFEGTYPLPESQLDRFMLRIELGYVGDEAEREVLARYGAIEPAPPAAADAPLSAEELAAARAAAEAVHAGPELIQYVQSLTRATREHPRLGLGLSTRGALATLRVARIFAGIRGEAYASPDDVKEAFPLVATHRLLPAADALLEGSTTTSVVAEILEQVAVPR